jgi:hypothetical protein
MSQKIDKYFSLNFHEMAEEYISINIMTKKNEFVEEKQLVVFSALSRSGNGKF